MRCRIAIDYLPAACHAPGVGRYVRELVRALVRLDDAPALALFEIGGGERVVPEEALGLVDGARVRRVQGALPRTALTWLHRLGGPAADALAGGVELFHRAFAETPPVARALQVLPVFELPPAGSAAEARFAERARAMDAVLAFSRAYAAALPGRLGVEPARVHVAPIGSDHWTRDLAARRGAAPAVADPPRIVVLGALRHERHPRTVLAGFEALRAGGVDARLVLVGRPASAAETFERALAGSRCAGEVTWVREPVEADMPALVASSSLLVHLADEEGTAVTPLEAFSFGVPVVASRLAAFEEALGEKARWVETYAAVADPTRLAEAMASGLADRTDEAACERRRGVAAAHPWSGNARATLALWRALLP